MITIDCKNKIINFDGACCDVIGSDSMYNSICSMLDKEWVIHNGVFYGGGINLFDCECGEYTYMRLVSASEVHVTGWNVLERVTK